MHAGMSFEISNHGFMLHTPSCIFAYQSKLLSFSEQQKGNPITLPALILTKFNRSESIIFYALPYLKIIPLAISNTGGLNVHKP